MDLKQIAKDTTKVVISYLTYQAVRTVIAQLGETDPPRSLWLHTFSTKERIQDGELYIRDLFQAEQSLAFRILTVREHLANEVCEFLPEMVRTGIQQSNTEQRRQQLERMTQFDPVASETHPEAHPEAQSDLGQPDGQPDSEQPRSEAGPDA
jgi:O-methyltransferase involved in polyketide biosynthesis